MKRVNVPSLFAGKQSKQTYVFFIFILAENLRMCISLILIPLKSDSQERAHCFTLTNANYSRATTVSHTFDSLPLLAQHKHGRKEERKDKRQEGREGRREEEKEKIEELKQDQGEIKNSKYMHALGLILGSELPSCD